MASFQYFQNPSGFYFLVQISYFKSELPNGLRSIYYNSNMTPRLRLHRLAIPKRDLNRKNTKPNIAKRPESLGVMLEF